jgi:hypothetical protein
MRFNDSSVFFCYDELSEHEVLLHITPLFWEIPLS